MNCAIVIPAYNPDAELGRVVRALLDHRPPALVVIDDGSAASAAGHFDDLGSLGTVTVIRHDVNGGKGTAIKTGAAHVYGHYPRLPGMVLVDADGQHAVEDVLRVGRALEEEPESLVIGMRGFSGNVPLRSRLGNSVSSVLFRIFSGMKLGDTQSGLRGVPRSLIPRLLDLPGRRYEFETEMLLLCRVLGVPVREVPITTIYRAGNPSSHFRPLADTALVLGSLVCFRRRHAAPLRSRSTPDAVPGAENNDLPD